MTGAQLTVPLCDAASESATMWSNQALTRVLHVINGQHYSGAERVQDLLAMNLPALGYEVVFACVRPDQFAQMRRSTCALVKLPMRWRFDLRVTLRLARLIQQQQIALVHAHTPRSALVGRIAAWWAGVPFVYHVHSPTASDSTRRIQNRINLWIEQLSLGGSARIIAVSDSLGRRLLSEGYSPERVVVIPNGVPQHATEFQRKSPSGVWTLGTIGLFRPRKGLEVLIDALGMLKARGAQVQLRAVGAFETPEYEQQIHSRARQVGVDNLIEWTGFTRNVGAELDRMDVLVLASLFGEGLPMVVLEAMAAGVPVVATSVEGVPEAVRHELDGILVAPDSAPDLADGIERLVSGKCDWEQLRANALERHAAHFSDRAMAASLAAVYTQILSASVGGKNR